MRDQNRIGLYFFSAERNLDMTLVMLECAAGFLSE
jgi:hypothetical protein